MKVHGLRRPIWRGSGPRLKMRSRCWSGIRRCRPRRLSCPPLPHLPPVLLPPPLFLIRPQIHIVPPALLLPQLEFPRPLLRQPPPRLLLLRPSLPLATLAVQLLPAPQFQLLLLMPMLQ
jgi:hypothetical protein